MRRIRGWLTPLGCFAGVAIATAPGRAQSPILQSGAVRVDLSGYVRAIVGATDTGYDLPGADRRTGFNGEVIRLKWLGQLGDRVRVGVHNRLQTQVSTQSRAGGGIVGFGVSAVPERSVNLDANLIENDHLRAWHDIDRLTLSVYSDAVDVTVGRQAITWGIAGIFPVADLWTQFSPFELDTEEKPGVDALRALAYPGAGIELDAVIADRGATRDLSAGVRATVSLPSADLYVAMGKFWRRFIALTGAAFVLDSWKVRGELAAPWDLDAERVRSPRISLGADRIGTPWTWSVEYHHNGLGSATPAGYASTIASPEFARGETYYLGRHYVGSALARQATDRLTLAVTALANVTDPSLALIPALNYDAGQNIRVALGALLSAGSHPVFAPPATIRFDSEFGAYGHSLYGTASFYF